LTGPTLRRLRIAERQRRRSYQPSPAGWEFETNNAER